MINALIYLLPNNTFYHHIVVQDSYVADGKTKNVKRITGKLAYAAPAEAPIRRMNL